MVTLQTISRKLHAASRFGAFAASRRIYALQSDINNDNNNNKSEPMLIRRATPHSSFCLQVFLVYLCPFRRNSFLKCAAQPKIAKIPIFFFWGGVGGDLRFFKVIDIDFLQSSLPVLVMVNRCLCLSATVFTLYEPIAIVPLSHHRTVITVLFLENFMLFLFSATG